MTWLIPHVAIYFVAWWLVLFAMLPFGVKTQEEDGDVTLGTVASAPRGPHMRRAVIRTTIVTALLYGSYLLLTRYFGLGFEDIPSFLPA